MSANHKKQTNIVFDIIVLMSIIDNSLVRKIRYGCYTLCEVRVLNNNISYTINVNALV